MLFQGFHSPEYTQTPNDLFDELLSQIESMAELKVLLVAVRKMFGWHKEQDRISLSQFVDATGMSERSVQRGIKQCLIRGTLRKVEEYGPRTTTMYELVMADDGVAESRVAESRVVKVATLEGQKLLPSDGLRVVKVATTKEILNKTKETNIAPKIKSSAHSPPLPLSPFQTLYLQMWGMKRFATLAQKDAVRGLELKFGMALCAKGLKHCAENNWRNLSSLKGTIETMSKGGPNGANEKRTTPKSAADVKQERDIRELLRQGDELLRERDRKVCSAET